MATTDTTPRRTVPKLSEFQRDLLFALAANGRTKGLAVKATLEDYYGEEINHGRLYPNLDALVDHGLVSKGEMDLRTNAYELTDRGRQALDERRTWERECLEDDSGVRA